MTSLASIAISRSRRNPTVECLVDSAAVPPLPSPTGEGSRGVNAVQGIRVCLPSATMRPKRHGLDLWRKNRRGS
jgi:hypothetical protein